MKINQIAKANLQKRNKAGCITLISNNATKLQYLKQYGIGIKQINRPTEQSREPRNKPTRIQSIFTTKKPRIYSGVGKTGQPHAKE